MESRSLGLKTRAFFLALLVTVPLTLSVAKETATKPRTTPQKNVKKKKPTPPVSKKNLKKGKNTDNSHTSAATKKKPSAGRKTVKAPVKSRPGLPTQTRAELLKMKADADAKIALAPQAAPSDAQAKEVTGPAPAGESAPQAASVATTGSTDSGPTEDQPIDADTPISESDLSAGGDEVALDLGGSSEEKWNPYTFGRSPIWMILPLFTLMMIGLHLLPVPKRIYPKRLSAVPDFLQLKDKTRSIVRPGFTNPSLATKSDKKKPAGDSSNG